MGYFTHKLTLEPESPDGRALPGKSIVARGCVVLDCEATPASVLFGARPAGTRCEESVTVRSLTGQRLRLKSIQVIGSGFVAEESAAAAGQIGVVVKHTVGVGTMRGSVLVAVERQDGKDKVVEIPVSSQSSPAPIGLRQEGKR